MKKLHVGLVSLALTLGSATAMAVPIATVGSLDALVAGSGAIVNSGDASELAWARTASGNSSLELLDRIQITEGGGWLAIDGGITTDYAYDFGAIGASTLFFGVKTGNLQANPNNDHWLFSNGANMQWGAINTAVFPNLCSDGNCNLGKFSHVTLFGVRSVPEPTTLALLSLGLIGVGIARRRKGKAA